MLTDCARSKESSANWKVLRNVLAGSLQYVATCPDSAEPVTPRAPAKCPVHHPSAVDLSDRYRCQKTAIYRYDSQLEVDGKGLVECLIKLQVYETMPGGIDPRLFQ